MRRMTILGVMCGVGMVAVGLAALRNANQVWQGVTITLTLGILGVAVLGAIQRRGRDRAWWVGFGIFGWGYILISQGPWFADQVGPKLATGQVLQYVRSLGFGDPTVRSRLADLAEVRRALEARLKSARRLARNPNDPAITSTQREFDAIGSEIEAIDTEKSPASRTWRAMLPGAANGPEFVGIGHNLCALVAASIGAAISRRFYVRPDRYLDPPLGTRAE